MGELIALIYLQFVGPHIVSEALSKALNAFCPCFLLIFLGAIAAFVFFERKRLALMRWWVAVSIVIAHIVLYVLISVSFLWLIAQITFDGSLGTAVPIGFSAVLVIGCFTLYYLLRRRFAHLAVRRRFVLMPLATVFLGVLGTWLALAITIGVLELKT